MSQGHFLTVPSSGEVARPFEVLLNEASAALPTDFPAPADEVLVTLNTDGMTLTATGATPHVFEGVHDLATAGAQVLIASSRAPEGVVPVPDALGFTDGWTLCNSGVTLVCVGGGGCEIVEERTFVPGPILEETAAAVPGSMFISMLHPGILLSTPFLDNEIEGNGHRIVSMEELVSTPTPRIVTRAAETDRKKFGRVLSSLDMSRTYEVFVGWTSQADIEPLGVAKVSGLESLHQRLGLPAYRAVAIGDGTNDIAVIEWVAFGVVMGGASEEVRARADHMTAVVDNDGAAMVMYTIIRRCEGTDH